MIRAVLDANVIISGSIAPLGASAAIFGCSQLTRKINRNSIICQPTIARIVFSFTGWMMPFSVMMPVMRRAGVTSKAGL